MISVIVSSNIVNSDHDSRITRITHSTCDEPKPKQKVRKPFENSSNSIIETTRNSEPLKSRIHVKSNFDQSASGVAFDGATV